MLVNKAGTRAIDSLSQVDGGNLWVYDMDASGPELLPVSRAKSISISSLANDLFCVSEDTAIRTSWEDAFLNVAFRLTARSISNPQRIVSQILIMNETVKVGGDRHVWGNKPLTVTPYVRRPKYDGYLLLLVNLQTESVESQQLDWWEDESGEGLEAVGGAFWLPNDGLLAIRIYRGGRVHVYDPTTRNVVRTVQYGGESGSGDTLIRRMKREVWLVDYGTLVCIDCTTWAAKSVFHARGSFIGELAFTPDESLCVFPRTSSGEVFAINTETYEVMYHTTLGQYPWSLALLPDLRIIARDWQTGELLTGQLA